MECREHEMSRERCLRCDICSLEVAYLTDHDNIRILTKKCLESACVGVVILLIYFGLNNSFKFVLDRILKCDDFFVGRIEGRQYRVECGGFTTSCRSCDENHSILFLGTFLYLTFGSPHEPEVTHRRYRIGRIEYTTYNVFSEFHGKGRDTYIDAIARIGDTILSILGNLREIQLHIRFVFESFQDELVLGWREIKNRHEIPIDSQAHSD